MNPRKSGDDRISGTRFAALDQPLLAISRSDANGCSVALCQRRQPPKAGAVGQRLQRVAGQPSLTIKSDGWSPVAAVPTGPRAALAKTISSPERTVRRLCAVSRRRQQVGGIVSVIALSMDENHERISAPVANNGSQIRGPVSRRVKHTHGHGEVRRSWVISVTIEYRLQHIGCPVQPGHHPVGNVARLLTSSAAAKMT